tara:strand:- start:7794 stop:8333 length:540 start_codon:yes stop_codon:yes gene_type:complete
MKINLFYFTLLVFPFLLVSKEVTQISCDEEIKLVIDEENMTNEEIVKAKDEYFKKLLAQANQECISKLAKTDNLSVTQTNSGGSISGSDIKKSKVNTNSQTLGTPKINKSNSKSNSNSINSESMPNGAIPACILNIKDNDQISVQLKEAIAKEKNLTQKNELIRQYAKYNNTSVEKLKC